MSSASASSASAAAASISSAAASSQGAAAGSVSSVPSSQLSGHTRSVLCLHAAGEQSEHPHLLLSGSEDSTCRVWDVRVGSAVRCVKAFGPSNPAVTAVTFHPRSPYTIFVAAEKMLHRVDLRMNRDQIIIRQSVNQFTHHSEEINQMSIKNSAGASFLAACDDEGEVCIVDLQKNAGQGQLYKTLKGTHTNVSAAPIHSSASTASEVRFAPSRSLLPFFIFLSLIFCCCSCVPPSSSVRRAHGKYGAAAWIARLPCGISVAAGALIHSRLSRPLQPRVIIRHSTLLSFTHLPSRATVKRPSQPVGTERSCWNRENWFFAGGRRGLGESERL